MCRFVGMANHKTKGKRDKSHASSQETATNKAAFVAQLILGAAPGNAAQAVGIARSTAYMWKKDDRDFSELWDDAVETALDDLETDLHKLAKAGDTQAIIFILKWRRRGVYNNVDGDRAPAHQENYFLNLTLEEKFKRLKRLGLPVPVIEPDYEIIDAGEDASRS